MKITRLKILNWDALGMATSIVCAIHCAILPLFLISLPILGINIIDNKPFEYGMIGLAFIIGCISFLHSFRKHHHRILPLILFGMGMFFLVFKECIYYTEIPFLIVAVLFIVGAHYINYRFCRKANHCHTNDCNHS